MEKKSILEKLFNIWIKKQVGVIIALIVIILVVINFIIKIPIKNINIIILIVCIANFILVSTLDAIGILKNWDDR